MPASLRPRDMLPGVHRVRAKAGGGKLAEYWYAWRGGPRILKAVAAGETALAREIARQLSAATAAYQEAMHPARADAFLSGLITQYLTGEDGKPPPHLAKLATRTQRDIRLALDVVRVDLGEMELDALKAKGARRALLDWRDRYASTPRTADARMEALARVLSWAVECDLIEANPLEKWPRLYSVNRADAIWTKADLVKLLKGAPAPFRTAILFAILTGLRGGDLVKITWPQVGSDGIRLRTSKSGGKRSAVIPLTRKLRALLNKIGRRDVGTVLVSATGKPWTLGGLKTAIQREKTAKGITGLRFHDLRGTAATNFIREGLPVADVAMILGWDQQRTAALASYVTADAVAAGMLKRLERNRSGTGL